MKITIDTVSAFRDQFHRMGRGEQFSYSGLEVLYNFLEEVDTDFDLDVIALCCDYTESSVDEALKYYGLNSLRELQDNTCVLEVSENLIIYQNY